MTAIQTVGHTLRRYFAPGEWRGGAGVLAATWVASMISMPTVQRAMGERGLVAGVIASVLLQAAVAVVLLGRAAGFRRTAGIVATVAVLAWIAEAIGSKTGVPFGAYFYTGTLQPQLLGVPLLIPLAWLMMLPPAWAVAQQLSGRNRGWRFAIIAGLAFTAWDLFLDPQMVYWGLWRWVQPGQYFGIPLVNYAGWLAVSALIAGIVKPPPLPIRPLLVIYTLTWLIETVGQIMFWQLYGPALCGFLGMGSFIYLAWRDSAADRGSGAERP